MALAAAPIPVRTAIVEVADVQECAEDPVRSLDMRADKVPMVESNGIAQADQTTWYGTVRPKLSVDVEVLEFICNA